MKLLVLDEDGKLFRSIGTIADTDMQYLITTATQLKFKCLSFIDFSSNTYFQEKQIYELKKEIDYLAEQGLLRKDLYQLLAEGVKEALSDGFLLLTFQP